MKSALLTFVCLLLSNLSSARCLVDPRNIESVARKVRWETETGEALSTSLIQVDASGSIAEGEEKPHTTFVYEAFLRPDADGTFQLLPIPLFVLEMKRNHNAVYVCAQFDTENMDQAEAVVFFLRNNEIKTILPKPLPLMGMKNFFWKNLKETPFGLVALPFGISELIQGTTVNLFAEITRIGIDRMRINNRQIELYSGGNPTQFDTYVVKSVIPFNK